MGYLVDIDAAVVCLLLVVTVPALKRKGKKSHIVVTTDKIYNQSTYNSDAIQ